MGSISPISPLGPMAVPEPPFTEHIPATHNATLTTKTEIGSSSGPIIVENTLPEAKGKQGTAKATGADKKKGAPKKEKKVPAPKKEKKGKGPVKKKGDSGDSAFGGDTGNETPAPVSVIAPRRSERNAKGKSRETTLSESTVDPLEDPAVEFTS